jgi:L-seryl-tRNA(Ser) seleniumtransferase
MNTELRAIPAVESLLRDPGLAAHVESLPHALVVAVVREVVDAVREDVRASGAAPNREAIVSRIDRRLGLIAAGRPARVINATGIILHTNLGRAVLGERVGARLREAAAGYSDLELDLETGERGRRERQVETLLRALTGAGAALVVNNCAAAVLLALDTFARGRDVIVSRGELVEIGGAFRMPEVVARSGARLVEVGTTNKTRLDDYRRALTPETSVFLKVHRSNFRISGFTESVSTSELVALAGECGVRVVRDLGSGATGLPGSPVPGDEPTLADEVAAGADVVAVSGDKLLGGPQAGIVVGSRESVRNMARNPLYRALRPGGLIFAALAETLRIHLEGRATAELPALRMLNAAADSLEREAQGIRDALASRTAGTAEVRTAPGRSEAGGGSLPGVSLPTTVVAVRPLDRPAHHVEARLREFRPPILVRVQEGQIVIDPRTLLPGEPEIVVSALAEALRR